MSSTTTGFYETASVRSSTEYFCLPWSTARLLVSAPCLPSAEWFAAPKAMHPVIHLVPLCRAALVARLNQLKSQLDSKPSAPLPAGRQLGSVAPSCLSSLQSPQLDVAPAALQTGTAITHGIVGHQLPLPALDATCFAQQPWASSMASAGPLHPDQFLRYPMTPLYTTAAAQELTSTTAPPSGLAGLPDQSLPGPPELGCSLPAAAPARQHSPLQMPFSHSIWHGQTAPSIAKPATVSQPLSEAIGVPCSWYQISEQAASGSLTNHGSAVADYESPDKCTSALPRVKETVTSTDPLLLEGPVEEASRMLRPPSFLCGKDLFSAMALYASGRRLFPQPSFQGPAFSKANVICMVILAELLDSFVSECLCQIL